MTHANAQSLAPTGIYPIKRARTAESGATRRDNRATTGCRKPFG